MKDIIEAFSTKVRSPIYIYFIFSWLAFNWQALTLLIFTKHAINVRLHAYNISASYYDQLIFPAVLAIALAVLSPWIKLLFLWLAKKPKELINTLHIKIEHNQVIEKQRLDDQRSERKNKLIEEAKKQSFEISSIENKNTRKELEKKLNTVKTSEEIENIQNNLVRLASNYSESGHEEKALNILNKHIDENMYDNNTYLFDKIKEIESNRYQNLDSKIPF